MKEKNQVIHNLEKELKEMKKKNNQNANDIDQPMVGIIVKKITGGVN